MLPTKSLLLKSIVSLSINVILGMNVKFLNTLMFVLISSSPFFCHVMLGVGNPVARQKMATDSFKRVFLGFVMPPSIRAGATMKKGYNTKLTNKCVLIVFLQLNIHI